MREKTHTTLPLRAGSDGLPASIAEYTREVARVAKKDDDHEADRQVEALGAFRESIKGLPLDHPAAYTLYRIAGAMGDSNTFAPGEKARSLFGKLGADSKPPGVETTRDELIAAMVDDLIEKMDRHREAMRQAVEKAEQAASVAEAAEKQREADAAEIQRLNEEVGERGAIIADLNEKIAYYRDRFGPKPPSKGRDKQKVPGEDNIYDRQNAAGETIYIVRYPNPEDSEKSKWETVGPDLEGARKRRDELVKSAKEKDGRPFDREAVTL